MLLFQLRPRSLWQLGDLTEEVTGLSPVPRVVVFQLSLDVKLKAEFLFRLGFVGPSLHRELRELKIFNFLQVCVLFKVRNSNGNLKSVDSNLFDNSR